MSFLSGRGKFKLSWMKEVPVEKDVQFNTND